MSTVEDEKVVTIHYTLKDSDGELLDASDEGDPLLYLQGAGNIVPGLEREILGKKVGDKLEVHVPAKDAYGERSAEPFEVPRTEFPADMELEPGMDLVMEDDEGRRVPLWIAEVTPESVTVDPNHPLAGIDLHFAIEVLAIRDATKDELAHGHPHGPGGHH